MSLRLMVIGHSYVNSFGQRKYAAFKAVDPTLTVRLVVPPYSGHVFGAFRAEVTEGLDPEDVLVLPQWFPASHMSYCHPPLRLIKEIRRFRPDIIHIEEDPYSVVGFETWLAVRLAFRSTRLTYFTWDNLNRRPRFPINVVKRGLTRLGFGSARLIVCGNSEAERLLRTVKRYEGLSRVLPQAGLDEADYVTPPKRDWRKELGIASDMPVIGFVGRLAAEKGVRDLLTALTSLKDLEWRALIVGSGDLDDEIKAASTAELAGRLICRKSVAHAEVPDLLKAVDIFTLPSRTTPRWIEQFGLTLAQAMMAGVACVGSSSGAIPEVMGEGGLVFQEGNSEALAATLRRLLLDPAARRAQAKAGQSIALARYTNRAVASAYLDAFGQVGAA